MTGLRLSGTGEKGCNARMYGQGLDMEEVATLSGAVIERKAVVVVRVWACRQVLAVKGATPVRLKP